MARVWSLSKATRFVDASYEQSTAFSITVPYRANSSLKISDIPTKLNSNFPLYELGNLYGISYYFFLVLDGPLFGFHQNKVKNRYF